MALIEIPWRPDRSTLRQFGLAGLLGVPLLGWMVLGWKGPGEWRGAEWGGIGCFLAAGVVLGGLALINPAALRLLFVGACLITVPIGMVVSELMLLILYFGVFTTTGVLSRLLGRDALQRRFDPGASSYWTPCRAQTGAEQYFRQS